MPLVIWIQRSSLRMSSQDIVKRLRLWSLTQLSVWTIPLTHLIANYTTASLSLTSWFWQVRWFKTQIMHIAWRDGSFDLDNILKTLCQHRVCQTLFADVVFSLQAYKLKTCAASQGQGNQQRRAIASSICLNSLLSSSGSALITPKYRQPAMTPADSEAILR